MRPHIVIVFQTVFVCLSLVRVPESRVTRGSGFLGGGEAYSGGRCKEECGFLGQRLSVMVTNPLVKEFLKSWRVLFFLFLKMLAQAKELTQCECNIAFACFCFMFTINVNNK